MDKLETIWRECRSLFQRWTKQMTGQSSALQYYLIAVPGALIAGAVIAAVSFLELPWIG